MNESKQSINMMTDVEILKNIDWLISHTNKRRNKYRQTKHAKNSGEPLHSAWWPIHFDISFSSVLFSPSRSRQGASPRMTAADDDAHPFKFAIVDT